MEDPLKIVTIDSDGNEYIFLLLQKDNNQNGKILYTLRKEGADQDFTIAKQGDSWIHIHGELPYKDCLNDIGTLVEIK